MEPINNTTEPVQHRVFQTTLISRWLAIVLFITLPFIAGYIGFKKGALMSEVVTYQTSGPAPTQIIQTPPAVVTTSSTTQPSLIDKDMEVPVAGTVNLQANNVTLSLIYASSVEEAIVIKDSDNVLQTITAPTTLRRADSCSDDGRYMTNNIKLQDIDFDGDLDMGILSVQREGQCANDYYTYYLYDIEKRQFATSSSLYFSGEVTIDSEQKILTFTRRAGLQWEMRDYVFYDGKYYLLEDRTRYNNDDQYELKDLVSSGEEVG